MNEHREDACEHGNSENEANMRPSNFKFQKELIHNKLLPYANDLDAESRAYLAKIKANLGRTVIIREMVPGCYIWVTRLFDYINLYGMRFTKEDHILFIKLMYGLVTMPKLEPRGVEGFSMVLISLLRKKKLISPEELELPWRPLYELVERVKKGVKLNMYRFGAGILDTLNMLVYTVKVYFPLSATQEILDELRPTLCPLIGTTTSTSLEMLEWFLPVQLPPKYHSIGHQLWFDEFMTLWEAFHNAPQWENHMMWLTAKLAIYNIGYIDWEPHIPLMFTRILRCLKLPVFYNKTQKSVHHKINPSAIAIWITAVLGNGSSAQMYLEKFLKSVETYFHPANTGQWLGKLNELLMKLPFHVITRLHWERFAKLEWETPVPEKYKLTDSDVDAFVRSMMPVVMTAMCSKSRSKSASQALQHLATMRPSIVISEVLEKVSCTLDPLPSDPHKLITILNCMVAIARPMAQGSRNVNKDYTYPEGPTHILPLLFLILPGIDPNDTERCIVTFRLISVYATYLPAVDSSKSPATMDDEELMIYETMARFEDFVLQFLDRIFCFIDSSSMESVRLESRGGHGKSKLEISMEAVLKKVCTILLIQTNDKIFECALRKLRTFITERILETKVAGQLAATLCRVFAQVNGRETVRALLPVLSQIILDVTGESSDIIKEENLDGRLLYAMLLLSPVVDTAGNNLLPHIGTLTNVLDHVLVLQSREGNNSACMLLRTVLRSLSYMIPYQFETTNKIRYWGEDLDVDTLKVKWYIPGKDEMAAVREIFFKYLLPEISKLQRYCEDWNTLTRDELLRSLNIVNNILQACEPVLPIWEEEPLTLLETSFKRVQFTPTLGLKEEILMPDNSNVRRSIAILMSDVQKVILKNVEDDIQSLLVLIQIWNSLLFGRIRLSRMDEVRRENYQIVSKMMQDKLVRSKGLMGPFVLQRADFQHRARVHLHVFDLTATHKNIILNLLELATSRYADVRAHADSSLINAIQKFPRSYTFIVPQLVDILGKDTEKHHEAYKGVLYILCDTLINPLIVTHDWKILRSLWPAIVLSKPSKKLSVIRLKQNMVETINKHFSTISITFEIPETCLTIARELWKTYPAPTLPEPTEAEIEKGSQMLRELEESNLKSYKGLMDDLLHALVEKNLHWRHRIMAMILIRNLVHPEQVYPPKVVRYFLGSLIHDSLQEREIAKGVVGFMLMQQKREHPKVTIDPPKISANDESQEVEKLVPGQRPDNAWLQYNHETRPLTAEQWDEPRFVHEPHIGYYTWPKKVEVCGPSSEELSLDPNTRVLTEHEKEVDVFFNDPQNVEKLIKFLSLEEKKGKDRFNFYTYVLFKNIFRNHGIVFLKHFVPHLYKLVTDKQESSQKCAAEIIAGIIRGSKYWPFHMVCEMWDSLLPIVRLVLSNLTVESAAHWGLCFATAQQRRDPNRQHWLLECLMEEPRLGESESSSVECGHFFILQVVLDEQSWRVSELPQRLLKRTENRLLTSPFENVRERLGFVLLSVFKADVRFPNASSNQLTPRMQDLIDKILPRLQSLVDENATVFSKEEQSLSAQVANVNFSDSSKESGVDTEDRVVAIRLLKTICKWIENTVIRSHHGLRPGFYQVFPILCQLENCEMDEELKKLCTSTLAVLAQAFTLSRDMPVALEAATKMSKHASWSTRSTCLEFIEVLVFHNMSTFLSNPTWVSCVKDIVLNLLEDEWVDVRKKAGRVLSGLLHCTFIPKQETLLEEFKRKANTKLFKKEHTDHGKEETKRSLQTDAIRIRHAAVLGMCAFIQAHPYDVPEYVPLIFEHLGPHIRDPQPIPTTIRKTLDDFKRTHYDGSRDMNGYAQHLTTEQLAVLQDLMMPPFHYA